MLKKRVIPVLLLSQGRTVKGKKFSSYRDTGLPRSSVRIYSSQDADELCFVNLDRSRSGFESLISILHESAEECFIPLTAGGGISEYAQIQELFRSGADKVLITSSAYHSPQMISLAAKQYGNQSVVAGIDYHETPSGPIVAIDHGRTNLGVNIQSFACHLQSLGAGEIFLNCITRDGMMKGYDLNTSRLVSEAVSIPVVSCGGAGNYLHIAELFENTSVSAAACASIFHFTDSTPIRARSYLRNQGIPMRRLK